MAYDVWDIIEDLLNDGDHSDHAVFQYSPEFDAESGNRVYSETWTAEWWHRQQISVGLGKNIIALIAYIDETPVTFNGRNMHPVYVSLGNIHVDFRYHIILQQSILQSSWWAEINRQANDFLDSFQISKCVQRSGTLCTFDATAENSCENRWRSYSSSCLSGPQTRQEILHWDKQVIVTLVRTTHILSESCSKHSKQALNTRNIYFWKVTWITMVNLFPHCSKPT